MYYFEIHNTIKSQTESESLRFLKVCEGLNIKPIIINVLVDLQPMTSTTLKFNTAAEAIEYAKKEAKQLSELGFEVTRIKVEAEPKFIADTNTSFLYSEVHLLSKTELLNSIDIPLDLYKSSNEFKPHRTFLTYRKPYDINVDINKILEWFNSIHQPSYYAVMGHNLKSHVEFAIFDTNTLLDFEWMNL